MDSFQAHYADIRDPGQQPRVVALLRDEGLVTFSGTGTPAARPPVRRDHRAIWRRFLYLTGSPEPEDSEEGEVRRRQLLANLALAGRLVISHAVDPLDGYDVRVYHVEDPVPADAEPVVPAPVEPLRRIRVIDQGGDSHADRTHAVLVAQVTAR